MISATSPSSPLSEINAALQAHNPFSATPILISHHVWGEEFFDVESFNSHASDAVFRSLEEVRAGIHSGTSVLITAQDGTGKTHIISRIRHRLQKQGSALFVYANKFDNLNQVKQGFQQLLAESLSNIGRQGISQWQELATSMANDAVKAANMQAQLLPVELLIKKFEEANEEQVRKWINQLTKAFCKLKSIKEPDIIRAIFWTLSEEQASYASNWLGGKELAQYKANELYLPTKFQSFDAVLQIFSLISEYNELVICFDELDVPECNDAGLHKSQVVSGLVKELFENLRKGVILTVMMPGVWSEKVKQLPPSVWSRLTSCGEPYDLKYMNDDSVISLVEHFLSTFYKERNLVPPSPIYPFTEEQLRELGREKLTVRRVLMWCRDNCGVPTVQDPVEAAFKNEVTEDIKQYLDDNTLIANALFFTLQKLIGCTIERVKIEDVTAGVKKRGGKDPYLNFKILGKEDCKDVSIGVAVLQFDGGGSLGAGLKRLVQGHNLFDLTRGCLIRSQSKSISSYLKKRYLTPLIEEQGGEFVALKEEEIKPLIAIRSVYQKREIDYNLTEEQIESFIKEKGAENLLGIYNPLVREILSDPSYQMPTINDEPECSKVVNGQDSSSDESNENELVALIS